MALKGWIVDKSAAARSSDPAVARALREVSGQTYLCPMGLLEYLYSARSAEDYDRIEAHASSTLRLIEVPPDILRRALDLQRELAHHQGLWHRTPIGDLVIAETALFYELGVVHIDRDFERIAAVRPGLVLRRLG